jgi:two-component system, OmpR family, KDP operon response regulator KdpE
VAYSSPIILVVDDDPDVRRLLQKQLSLEGYGVELAPDGTAALARLAQGGIALVLLDRGLPDRDGLEICRAIRAQEIGPGVSIIMLTAAIAETERLAGFAAGVDDYVAKPFSVGELVARITAVLRRTQAKLPVAGRLVVDEHLQIDFGEREAIVAGERVRLRPTEARLLALLVERAGRTLPYEEILAQVWGPEYRDETHYVHLYITYLRQKIEPDPSRPRYLVNKRGLGYCFAPMPGSRPTVPQPDRDVQLAAH